ncbi:hypothetical protein ADUPG1_013310 [Aduncisulcus paluster]|uniref:Uncharacterized protein n=1 Tax=Aduncisulcus paluster TaxID=2918883 RepID=A0ABQ5K4A1_9EUKA|nr:hypothetical protein ADUPG1_013310 [Aduncisulcus paluster]
MARKFVPGVKPVKEIRNDLILSIVLTILFIVSLPWGLKLRKEPLKEDQDVGVSLLVVAGLTGIAGIYGLITSWNNIKIRFKQSQKKKRM